MRRDGGSWGRDRGEGPHLQARFMGAASLCLAFLSGRDGIVLRRGVSRGET